MATSAALESALCIDRLEMDRLAINGDLAAILPPANSAVQCAMRYAVLGPGQRLRPILALRVARVLGKASAVHRQAGAAIELLHCASLIVDDLPCMDNDGMRRNRAAVHVEYGEATAVLAAFALVALAARSIADEPAFQIKLLKTLDCDELIKGQALDLALGGSANLAQRSYVTSLKTVPLFQLAVEAGVLATEPSLIERAALFGFGREFGAAYQTLDDYMDGEISDPSIVDEQFSRARDCLRVFGAGGYDLTELLDYLNAKIAL